jgi:hypothetical protein
MSSNINLTIYNDYLTPRTLITSNIVVSSDSSNIYLNAQIVSNATNIGANGPVASTTNNLLVLKNLTADPSIGLSSNNSMIQISAVPGTTVVVNATGMLLNNISNDILVFKDILTGVGISFAGTNTTIMINADVSAQVTNATNLGGNTNGLFINTTSLILLFKNLTNGSFITLSSNNSIISINAVATTSTIVTGATNLGGNSNGLFINISNSGIMNFKTLTGGTYITSVSNNSTVRFNLNPGMVNIINATNINGVNGVFSARAANGTLTYKCFRSGNVLIGFANNNSTVTITYNLSTVFYITNATNLGGSSNGLFLNKTTEILNFKTIRAGSYINIGNNVSSITFHSATIGNSTGGSGVVTQNITTSLATNSFLFSSISTSIPAVGINVFNNITNNFADRYQTSYISALTTTGFSLTTKMDTVSYAQVDNAGAYASMKMLSNRNLAIAYYNTTSGFLNFAYNSVIDATGLWESLVVDNAANFIGQYASMAISSNDKPMIAYYDSTNDDLKFAYSARNDGTGLWTVGTIDTGGDVGQYASLAVMADGFPAVAYYDVTGGNLKFARNNTVNGSGTWTTTTVVNTDDIGQYASLATLAANVPGIAYYDVTNADLKFARNAAADGSGAWTITTIDSTGNVGQYASLVVLPSGFPAVAYYDATNGALKYAVNDTTDGSGTWTLTTVDDTGDVGQYASLNVLGDGSPGIAYYDVTNSALKLARFGSAWVLETVDQSSGQYNSLGTTFDGNIAIAYCTLTPTLKFATSYSKTSFPSNTATFTVMWLKK